MIYHKKKNFIVKPIPRNIISSGGSKTKNDSNNIEIIFNILKARGDFQKCMFFFGLYLSLSELVISFKRNKSNQPRSPLRKYNLPSTAQKKITSHLFSLKSAELK